MMEITKVVEDQDSFNQFVNDVGYSVVMDIINFGQDIKKRKNSGRVSAVVNVKQAGTIEASFLKTERKQKGQPTKGYMVLRKDDAPDKTVILQVLMKKEDFFIKKGDKSIDSLDRRAIFHIFNNHTDKVQGLLK